MRQRDTEFVAVAEAARRLLGESDARGSAARWVLVTRQ